MSMSRGEIAGFLRAQKFIGKTDSEAKEEFKKWLALQDSATATDKEKEMILSDLDSYKV